MTAENQSTTSSINIGVFQNVLFSYSRPEDSIDPDLVTDNGRHTDRSHDSHDLESQQAGRGVEDRQVGRRIDAGRKQAGEQAGNAGEYDKKNGQARTYEGFPDLVPAGKHLHHKQGNNCNDRYDK